MTTTHGGKRIAIYARVSTRRQADNDLSVPDQIAQGKRWIDEQGVAKVATFVDAGASGNEDGWTEVQAMITLAMSDDRPIDIILIHSLARLFRNALHFTQ